MFNLAIRGHDISRISSIEELAARTKKYGIKNLQLALNKSFPEWDGKALSPGLGNYVKTALSQENVEIALLSCYSNLIHPNARRRIEILENFENYLFHARFFQASMVASETGSVLPEMGYSEENFTEESFADLIRVVKRLVHTGEKVGTMVGIEGGLNHPLYSNSRILQLVHAVPSEFLGIIYDPTNLINVENSSTILAVVEEAFQQFGNKIVCVHLKDFIIKGDEILPVALGDGVLPYKEILHVIHSYKPHCYIVLEETRDEKIDRAVKLINKL